MSSNITSPSQNSNPSAGSAPGASPADKGKKKAVENTDEEEEEEEEDDEEMGSDEEEEEEEETYEEIDPTAIISTGRRTRGVRVDYTSKEALEKAGLKNGEEEEEEDEDVEMQ